MAEPSPFGEYKVREKQNYHQAMMEALILSDKEAAQAGVLEAFEDLIDSWWANIPTQEKLRKSIKTRENGKVVEVLAMDAWEEASKIEPPPDVRGAQRTRHRANKERALRKKQVLIDLLSELDFLFKRPRISRSNVEEDTTGEEWGDDGEW